MTPGAASTRSRLDAWRDQGADRMDPVGFQRLVALEQRAAAQQGEVRRLLDARLAELVRAYAEELHAAAVVTGTHTSPADARSAPPRSALADLIDDLASHTAQRGALPKDAPRPSPGSDSPVLDELRQACAQVRTGSQLRQALAPAPADAGPLNSASLVHRALTEMRELSPDYLAHFIAYVDALSALEPVCAKTMPLKESAPGATSRAKQGRAKPRRRPA